MINATNIARMESEHTMLAIAVMTGASALPIKNPVVSNQTTHSRLTLCANKAMQYPEANNAINKIDLAASSVISSVTR